MNKQKWIMLLVALAMIGGGAGTLSRLKKSQKLGLPGIKTAAIADSGRLNIYLPERVLDFDSILVPTDTNVFNGLPRDTSFMQRHYSSASGEGGQFALNIVLMGADRTSMHKPEFCLPGAGWNIDQAESSEDKVPLQRPYPYDLPVMKLAITREITVAGEKRQQRGIFLYWFVTDHEIAGTRNKMLWRSATHLLTTGELQRWAYVGCLTACWPGEERAAAYERMKRFLAAAVPEFQLVPGTPGESRELSQAAAH